MLFAARLINKLMSKISRVILSVLCVFVFVFAAPAPIFAAGKTVTVAVQVKNSVEDDAQNLSNVYVAMYAVSVMNDEWWGKQAQVKLIPKGKKAIQFSVNAGQAVDFLVFETKENVLANKKRQFYAPPLKNFSATDGVAQLCYVAGVDFSKKMPDLQCATKDLQLVYTGTNAHVVVQATNGDEGAPLLSNYFVGMYNIAIVDGNWWGELAQVKKVPAGKTVVTFFVTPGQVVDFKAFKTSAQAQKNKIVQFTVPPNRNFSADDGVAQVCLIAGVDVAQKLESDGQTFCGNNVELVL